MANKTTTYTSQSLSTLNQMYLSIGVDPRSTYLTFIQPWFVMIGVVANALIVIVFTFFVGSQARRNRGEVATVSRIYYILIGLCEFCACLCGYFIRDTLFFVPLWITGGQVVINLYYLSEWTCKIMAIVWYEPFNFIECILMFLAFERMLAVLFPLRAKSILGVRFTIYANILYGGTYTAISGICHILITTRYVNPNTVQVYFCLPDSTMTLNIVYNFVFAIFSYLYFLTVISCTIAVAIRILSLKYTRAGIQSGQRSNATLKLREISSAVTMMVLVGIYILVDIPTVIAWNTVIFYNYFVPSATGNSVIFNVTKFVQELSVIPMCFNFVFYFIRIPAFRQGLKALFRCDLCG